MTVLKVGFVGIRSDLRSDNYLGRSHCLVRIAPGILTIAASELLPAFVPGVSNETGQHGDAGRANQGIIEALFGSETDREGPHSR